MSNLKQTDREKYNLNRDTIFDIMNRREKERGDSMARIDVMTDIETLGRDADSTIFQISAIAFDINTGIYFNKFNMIADIGKNKENKITGDTIKWWLNTNKELFTKLLNSGTCSSETMIREFRAWLELLSGNKTDVHLWGNGILFDNKMIQTQMNNIGLDYPIFYRNDRDMRTLVELASHKVGIATEKEFRDKYKSKDLIEHDAFDDVKEQINITVMAYDILMRDDM